MKDFLEKLIAKKKAEFKAAQERSDASNDLAEVRALGATLASLRDEIADAENQLAQLDEPADNGGADEGRKMNVLDTLEQRGASKKPVEMRATDEYRKAFMDFVCRGVSIPAEMRADATTSTTDASAAIPVTLLDEITQKLDEYGEIFARVRKMNVQGGVKIPILSLKPTASWIAEGTDSDTQKIQANTAVSFSYYGLECKIAQTLLTSVVTIDAFEKLFSDLAVKAIAKALDIAIVKGAGTSSPTGITVDSRVPTGNAVTLVPADFTTWSGWKKKVFAKMKKAYRKGVFLMAQGTFDGYIDGMVDTTGQPIGRVNYGIAGEETYRFGGKEVLTVEDDVIADYDTASTGDVVAVFVNLDDYVINSNLEMQVVKWVDHDTNTVKNKAILICDGKLVDPNGVIIIKKGAAQTGG